MLSRNIWFWKNNNKNLIIAPEENCLSNKSQVLLKEKKSSHGHEWCLFSWGVDAVFNPIIKDQWSAFSQWLSLWDPLLVALQNLIFVFLAWSNFCSSCRVASFSWPLWPLWHFQVALYMICFPSAANLTGNFFTNMKSTSIAVMIFFPLCHPLPLKNTAST